MKVLDIAVKDMLRSFRSLVAVGMMFIAPLLITGLIAFAFGGVLTSSETGAYTLPVIPLQIVNGDQGDPATGVNMGQYLVEAFTSDSVRDVFAVTLSSDPQAARAAVDNKAASLALVIPANFTQAAVLGQGAAEVEMYQDPTLTFGPGIVKEILGQFLDALTGGSIAGGVLEDQFRQRGAVVDEALAAQAQAEYAAWFASLAGERTWNLPVMKRVPNKAEEKSITDHRTNLLGPVMAGMLVFFLFYTGISTAETIIREQEEGTLERMFTTPTPIPTILAGKFASIFLMLVVQAVVLLAASSLVFGIDWGSLVSLAPVVLGVIAAAAGFGIFLMSFVRSTRQAGPVTGGVLTLTGMAGGLFSTGLQGVPAALDTISLTMPQGWALRGLRLVLAGAQPQDILLPLGVTLAFGIVFFALGARGFRRRFA